MKKKFKFTARIWLWQPGNSTSTGTWYFVTTDEKTSVGIRLATLGLTNGFGSVRVRVTVGATTWGTSVFPHRESGGWILPLKADVRKREKIGAEDTVTVVLEV